MQELVSWAVDQIALEGPKGCNTGRFLAILEEARPLELPGGSRFEVFPPKVVAWLWDRLVSLKWEVEFFRKTAKAQAAQKKGKPKKGGVQKEDTFDLVPIPDKETLRTFDDVDKEAIHVVAHHSVRDVALGMFDDHLTTFKISDIQRVTLEYLGFCRRKGALRPDLCKRANSESTKFHYVLKLLEARRLVVVHNVLAKEDSTKQAHGVWTAVVHLRRFAPRLSKEYYFKEVGAEGERGQYVVSNDFYQQLRGICAALQGATNRTLLEADIKKALGFKQTVGHRMWRRLRANLETNGYIKAFRATVGDKDEGEGKAKTLLELLKPYPPSGAGGQEEDADGEEEGEGEGGGEGVEKVDMVAERGLDWQVINLLLQAGEEGMFKHRLCRRLGLSQKKVKKRLDDIQLRYGLVESNVQDGKQVVKLWKVPESVLLHHRQTSFPTAPEGGHMAAFMNALASRPSAAATATAQEAGPSDPQEDEEMEGSDEDMPVAERQAREMLQAEDDLGIARQDSLAGMLKAEPHVVPEEVPLAEGVPTGVGLPAPPDDMLAEDVKIVVQNVGIIHADSARSKTTELARDRLQRLIDKVEKDDYILRIDVARFFLDQEGVKPEERVLLDKRTVQRIVDRGVAIGKMQHYSIHVPTSRTGKDAATIPVVLKPGLQLESNPDLIKKIRITHHERGKRISMKKGRKPTTQHVEEIVRLFTARPKANKDAEEDEEDIGQGESTQTAMWENGFIQARMVRVRMLHGFLCKLVGLAGSEEDIRNVLTPQTSKLRAKRQADREAQIQAGGSRSLVPVATGASGKPFVYAGEELPDSEKVQEERAAIQALAEQNKGLFTVQALWEAMPLDMYCQVVGNANRHPAIVQLLDKGLTMGDLLPEEYQAIVDLHARRRLNLLMNILCRMELLRGLLISENSHVSRIERSVYIVKPDVCFDEPKRLLKPDYVGDDLKEKNYDLRLEDDLESYWNRLDYVCSVAGEEVRKGKPGCMVPELFSRKSWNKDRMMSMRQWLRLKSAIMDQVEEFGWQHAHKLAAELNLPVEQVTTVVATIRLRVNRERTRQQLSRLPHLPTTNGRSGTSKYETKEEKQKVLKEYYQKSRTGWTAGVSVQTKAPTLLRPWDIADQDVAELERKALHFKKLVESDNPENREEIDDMVAEFQQQSAAYLPQSMQADEGPATRRRYWSMEEDRFVLSSFVKWHAVAGFKERAFRSQQRPMVGIAATERQGNRRIKDLEQTPHIGATLAQMSKLVQEVHLRMVERGDGPKLEITEEHQRTREAQQRMKRAIIQKHRKEAEKARLAGLPITKEQEARFERAEELLKKAPHVVPFPEPPAGMLFAVADDRDRAAHERVLELLEDVLATTARKPGNKLKAGKKDSLKRPRLPGSVGDAEPAKRIRRTVEAAAIPGAIPVRRISNNLPEIRTLAQQLQRTVTKSAQSKAKLLASETKVVVTPPIAAAVELIVSLMSKQESQQVPVPDSHTALMRRFPTRFINDAFQHLRILNYVMHGNSGKNFRLTADFNSLTKMVELPETVFEEASRAASQVENSDTGFITVTKPGEEVAEGMVAEILTMVANGTANLSIPPPQAEGAVRQDPGAAGQRNVGALSWSVVADVSQAHPSLPTGLPMQPHKPPKPPTPLVDPVEVQSSPEVRARTWSDCMASAGKAKDARFMTLLKQAYSAIQRHGAAGPTPDALAAQLSASLLAITAVLDQLQLHGLVCRVPGYTHWVYVASEFTACFFTDPAEGLQEQVPHLGLPDQAEPAGVVVFRPQAAPSEEVGAPKRGSKLLAPWLDHKGGLNIGLWTSLVRRLMSIVISTPGIKEEDLLSEMVALTPMSAKRLLDELLEQELVLVNVIKYTPAGPPRCLGGAHRLEREAKHYFADPRNCFSKTATVLPVL